MSNKFIVAGIQRAGTTLIRTCIDSHPQARCAGEVFKIRNRRGNHYKGELGYPAWLEKDATRRLGHYVWRTRNVRNYLDETFATPGYAAVGFKFMYSHTRLFPMVIPYVKEHGIRVIHIYRKNVFKKLLSRLTARARGQFHSDRKIEVTRVSVPTRGLVRSLERIEEEGMRWKDIFEGSVPYMRTAYEDFVERRDEESNRMIEFLGLQAAELSSSLVKLNPDDLSKVVENFDEVKSCLEKTQFAWCVA